MSALAKFQFAFASNLLSRELIDLPACDSAAMNVYRNTVIKGLIDALAANYPTVLKLVGEEWFDAAASEFIRSSSASTSVLAEYGKEFATFLSNFSPAVELPYLSEIANIDWLWTESCFALDAPTLRSFSLQALQGEQLLNARLQLHPATRLCACKHSAVTIWLHNHANSVYAELNIDGSDEEALITRTQSGVILTPLSIIEHRFVSEIQNGATLGEAAMTVLSFDPQFPLAATLAKLINVDCFADTN